jgi:diguanylate cyclase (GGDEF)-like protein
MSADFDHTARSPLEALLEVAGDVALHFDLSGRITFCSHMGEHGPLRGLRGVLGVGCNFLDYYAEAQREAVREALEQAAPGQRVVLEQSPACPDLAGWHFEFCGYAAAGRRGVLAVGYRSRENGALALAAAVGSEARDALTGLLERGAFRQAVGGALVSGAGESFVLALVALQGLRRVSDSLGSEGADLMLQQAAARLRENVRATDVVARTGFDEFALLLRGAKLADARGVLRKLALELEFPFILQTQNTGAQACLGAAAHPEHGDTFDALFSAASRALDVARVRGESACVVFDEPMAQQQRQTRGLHEALHEALREGEFYLHYQPLVRPDGGVYSVEALMRWTHEGRSVSPAQFIPLVEDCELVHLLGGWALKAACAEVARWSRRAGKPYGVSVNVSPRQFRGTQFSKVVQEALRISGLAPQQLQLEITEGALMADPEWVAALLEELAAQGVRVAVDDFGTGYSSLAYLKRFKLHALKVDRSFVKDLPASRGDLAICRSVCALARELGLRSVAEGVETREQLEALLACGCDFFQGYYFSKPMRLAEVELACAAQPTLVQPVAV